MTMTVVDVSPFPKFGTMTSGNGLAGIFDAAGPATTGYAQTTWGTVGVDCSANPQSVDRVELTSASNGWDGSGAFDGPVSFRLYGRNSTAPSHQFDGTLLGSSGPIRDRNEVSKQSIYSHDWWTKWDYLWVYIAAPVWTIASDFRLHKPDVPVIDGVRSILRRRCDGSQPITRSSVAIPGLRVLFDLRQPAGVVPLFSVEFEHLYWHHLQDYTFSCGGYILHRTATTLQALPQQGWQELQVCGRNLDRETHYERVDPMDAISLQPGFHEIVPSLNATSYQTAADNLTQVLVEGGRGLNKALVLIDPSLDVINLS